MAFTVQNFRELIQLLEQHPDWRQELRRWVLSEELLNVPQALRELAEAQRHTDETIAQLAQRVDQLTQRMDQLVQRMDQLVDVQLAMGKDLERLKGSDMERRYRERGHAYFSRVVRRAHVLSGDELGALLDEALSGGVLSEDQARELLDADVVVRGRKWQDDTEVFLVVEVSWGVGISDVQRAAERAALLRRTGKVALPVVAGAWVTPEAQEPSRAFGVWQVTDGHVVSPEGS